MAKVAAVVLAVAAVIGLAVWRDLEHTVVATPPAPAQVDLSRLSMAQAVAHCHRLWLTQHWDQAPLALAWHPHGVDWYVLEGVDRRSMRHFSCTGRGIEQGARFERPLQHLLPAPAVEGRSLVHDLNLFLRYAARTGEVGPALEALQDPADPTRIEAIERRWLGNGHPDPQGAAAAGLPLLFSQPPATLATQGLAPLQALKATDWIQQPDAMFSLLVEELPADTRIAAIDVRPDSIRLSIVGPVKNFDDKPPAAYGDATFDAYGIRDTSWWYPRDSATQACTAGYSLAEVKALYAQAANRGHPRVWNAVFGCPDALIGPAKGAWTLRVPKRR